MKTELTITAKAATTKPNYERTAAELLGRCRAFYQNPENEKAFQEWKAQRQKKREAV